MRSYLERYTQPSYIFDDKLFHGLRLNKASGGEYSDFYVWFETEKVKKRGSACGKGYLRVQVIYREGLSEANPWGEKVTTLLNFVLTTALSAKDMKAEESQYGWVGSEELIDAVESVLDLNKAIDAEHLLQTFIRNRSYNRKYDALIQEDIPEYLILQSMNADTKFGLTGQNRSE